MTENGKAVVTDEGNEEKNHPLTTIATDDEEIVGSSSKTIQNDGIVPGREPPALTRATGIPTSGIPIPGAFSVRGTSMSSSSQDQERAATLMQEEDQNDEEETAPTTPILTATAVNVTQIDSELALEEMEQHVRDKIMREAVEADAVQVEKRQETTSITRRKLCILVGGLVSFVIILLIIGIIVIATTSLLVTSPSSTSSTTATIIDNRTTLDSIRQRGFVRCGIFHYAGFAMENTDTGELEGSSIVQCRAISIAIFGTPNNVEYTFVDFANRFQFLVNRTVDVLTAAASYTMSRNVYESTSQSSLTYTTVYQYLGVTFNGVPEYVHCAENLDTVSDETCRHVKICISKGSRANAALESLLPGGPILVRATSDESIIENMNNGTCNVYAGLYMLSTSQKIKIEYEVGTKLFSKELMGVVTRKEDPEFSNLVNLVVNVFILADSENITQANAYELGKFFVSNSSTEVENETNYELSLKMIDIISEFGNHGDVFSKYFWQSGFASSPINMVYNPNYNNSGLLYTIPFGDVQVHGPSPIRDSTLDTILSRGHIRCGVVVRFTNHHRRVWSEFHVDFCRAVAGAMFSGRAMDETIEITPLSNSTEAYISLSNGSVDVVAGARVTLEADYHIPITGEGYTFSPPYFYDKKNDSHPIESTSNNNTSKMMDAYAMMTSEKDKQWSDFVYWVTMSLFYAEEKHIDQSSFSQMPSVNLFGENLKQMFRFAIMAVGSYGQIYNRTLENIIPRSGANTLNSDSSGPQLVPIPYH